MTADGTQAHPDPAEYLAELIEGFQTSQALHVAAKLGLFDVLRDGAKSSEEIAASVGAHAPSLLRLLRFLVKVGVLAYAEGDRFAATPLGELLRADHPDGLHSLAVMMGSPFFWHPYGALYASIKSGERAFDQVFGMPFFAYLEDHPEDAAIFNADMSAAIPLDLLDAYDFSTFRTIVDVAGGQGMLLQAILERCPQASGVLFDQPSVIAQAPRPSSADVAARFQAVAGDMFASVPAGGDAYVLRRIIHDWGDDEAIRILRNCRQAMHQGGKVLLIEQILHPGDSAGGATGGDLIMLVFLSGRERTQEEYAGLLAAADLRLVRVIPAGPRSVIEATPM